MNIHANLHEDQLNLIHSPFEGRTNKITCNKKYISNNYLNGEITVYQFEGFCCAEYDLTVLKDCHERIIVDSEFIQISFAMSGKSMVLFTDGSSRKMKAQYVQLAYLPKHTVDIKMLKKEKKVSHIRFIFSKSFFLELTRNIGWNIEKSYINKVLESNHFMFGSVAISAEMEILSRLKEVLNNNYPYPLDSIFLRNKISEILIRIHYLFENKKSYVKSINENISDEKQLEQVRKYIDKNYSNLPTIRELSRIVYLNEFKLKKGFKHLFGCTIHEYVTNTRMKKAKELLSQNMTISDVSSLLGYKSSSHFIQIFKKYFGTTPRQIKIMSLLFVNKVFNELLFDLF